MTWHMIILNYFVYHYHHQHIIWIYPHTSVCLLPSYSAGYLRPYTCSIRCNIRKCDCGERAALTLYIAHVDYCINGYGSKTTNRIKQNYILVNILSDSNASAIHQCCARELVTLLVENSPPLTLAILMLCVLYQTFCVVEIHIAVE